MTRAGPAPPVHYRKIIIILNCFLIIDGKEVYHFGASLKDLGKKWFAFSKLHIDPLFILKEIKAADSGANVV